MTLSSDNFLSDSRSTCFHPLCSVLPEGRLQVPDPGRGTVEQTELLLRGQARQGGLHGAGTDYIQYNWRMTNVIISKLYRLCPQSME